MHIMQDRRIWLVGLHMVNEDHLIMFGGQAISDNNLKFSHILKYSISNNTL
jgi:hypothetical protein